LTVQELAKNESKKAEEERIKIAFFISIIWNFWNWFFFYFNFQNQWRLVVVGGFH
jgi:hypothetical protein